MTKTPFVLIVEDDGWLAEQYIRTLALEGVAGEFVPHALAAIEIIDTKIPDALLLDVMLPGGNIFALLHELRSHTDLAAIPIVLCTNGADALAGEDLTPYGVSYVLDKTTMKPGDVAAAIKKVLP